MRRPSSRSRPAATSSVRRHFLTALGALGGAVLLVVAVRRAGVADILEGMQRVGWGLSAILALAGLRFLIRAECWRLCMPPEATISRRQALEAFLAGDAVGSVTPLGPLASEPAKVFLTRHHLATRESVASLAAENLVYAVSVAVMVAVGLLVLLATVPLPPLWQGVAGALLAAAVAGAAAAWRLLHGTWDDDRGSRPKWRERLAGVRVAVLGVLTAHPARIWRILALDLAFHALAVFEIFITLQWLLGDRSPTLAQAIVFEALNRVVIVAFKFVPFRIGVDEALTGALAP
ncbi:MAG: flippase-like domain-containing protein, partial [Acidobacteria bacterium]|nr:flippase-like domain-containing protein [Acidobacteriota bacterium]